jgi:uncharacterized protein (TIGR02246 family)
MLTDDERAIRDLGEAMRAAEAAFDPAIFETAVANDAVIMPPGNPAIVGRDACLDFIRAVLADTAQEFSRRESAHEIAEVQIHGNIAIDRGQFRQTLTRREDGAHIRDDGQFLRMYSRDAGGHWQLARVIWNQTTDEPEC